MIKRIISGGQTGVDRAALDVAIKLDIPHGGWIPKGRLTENGPLPQNYQLKETSTSNYSERTEKNVVDTDGTLIISRGQLTGGSEYTREMAQKHIRPWLHIDLNQTSAFQAASSINKWISKNEVEILNVAGPRASKDPQIYRDTVKIIESVYYLGMVEGNMSGPNPFRDIKSPRPLPTSVDEAVERLISEMALKDKISVANMSEGELANLYLSLGRYILNTYGLMSGNSELIESCRSATKEVFLHDEDAVTVILKSLWERLRTTHRLRRVK